MHIILKISKYLLLSVAVIAIAAVVFVETGYFKSYLKNTLASQIGPITGGRFTVNKISGNVFTGITLEEVRLAGAGGQVFYSEKIEAFYSLPALMAGRYYFNNITLTSPSFTISQDSALRWSYSGLFPSSKSGAGNSVLLREVRINNGTVSVKFRNKPAVIEITNINLSASAAINGDTTNVGITTLSAKSTRPALDIKAVSGSVQVKGRDLNIKGLRLSTEYSKLSIDGTIKHMARPVFDINIDCPEGSLKDISALDPRIRPIGAFSSNIKLTGGLDELKIVQSFKYNSLKIDNEALFRPEVPSLVVNSRITGLKPCDIMPVFAVYKKEACPTGELSLDISIQAQGRNLDGLRSSVSVKIHPSKFAGFSVGESTITAVIAKRLVSLNADIEVFREHFAIAALGLAGEKAFRLDKLKVESAHFGLSSKGVMGYGRNEALDMTYNLKQVDLGFVSVFLDSVKMEGILSSTGSLKGTLSSSDISAELEGRDLLFSGLAADSVKAKVSLKGFKLPPDGTADVQITGFKAGGTAFDNISILAQNRENTGLVKLRAGTNTNVEFLANAGFKETGKSIFLFDINKISVSAGTSTWSNDGDIKIEASSKQIKVESLRISNGPQLITASGVIGSLKNMNMDLRVKNADTRGLGLLTGIDIPLEGIVNADIGIEGSYLSPHISGTVDIVNAEARGLSFDKIPAKLKYAEKNLKFEARVENKGKTLFSVEGAVPVDLSLGPVKKRIQRTGLRVSIKNTGLGFDILPGITEQVRSSSGKIQADILIEGDPMSPKIKGNIGITGGTLTLAATEAEYHDINASIELDNNEILLRHFTLKSGDGNAELTGKIMLKGFVPADAELKLACRDFKVMNTNIFTGSIDSDIKIKGLYAAGNVTLTQGVVNIPSHTRVVLSEIEFIKTDRGGAVMTVPSATASPEFYKLLSLDLHVLAPGKTWVYAQNVSAEVKGDLDITKKKNGPMSYAGEINALRGIYKINERPLSITRAKIIPRGSDFLTSLINAKASCVIGDVSIDVLLGGTLDNPIITFQSDPSMERKDIIAYLAFGAQSTKLSQSQSASLQNTSFDVMAGFAEKDIKGMVSKVVPIDELTLKPSEGSWGVGKNITDRLTAKYEWRSGQDESPQTLLDYKLDKHYSLNSQLGDPKTSGVDLFWKFDY
ncbi:MAG: translocation/assembly module TamB domain-containing protein [Elusimicrobia bacterium]|nr:translocation/assembly module TamB domain-containing protein [Candidatus Liberimonas magnetica]